MDDRELAVEAQSGEHAVALQAFEELLVRYETRIFQYILSRVRNHADAEDLTQKTFLAAWKNRQMYKSRYPYGAWIFTIARNQTISHFRRKRPMPGATDFSLDFSDERSPAFQLDDHESRENLWVWIEEELGETQHTALWLTYKEDYSVKETAAALNKSVAATKVLLHRARKACARRLTEQGVDRQSVFPPLAPESQPVFSSPTSS